LKPFKKDKISDLIKKGEIRVLLALFILIIIIGVNNPRFFSVFNLQNVLRTAAPNAIAAFGMTYVTLSGSFADLSVGSMMALLMVISAFLLNATNPVIAIIGTIAAGALFGAFNGSLTVKGKLPSIVVTLGMLYVFRAIAYIVTDNSPIYITNESFIWLGNGIVLGIPVPVIIMAIMFVLFSMLMRFTSFGRRVKATGDNDKAAFFSGIKVDKIKIIAFVIVGISMAVAGILRTARMYSASPRVGVGHEFLVIAMVILGGTRLNGGKGTIIGSLLGALFFATLDNGLNLLGIRAYWQYIVMGLILIIAIANLKVDIKSLLPEKI